jgi:hypothetical protein
VSGAVKPWAKPSKMTISGASSSSPTSSRTSPIR